MFNCISSFSGNLFLCGVGWYASLWPCGNVPNNVLFVFGKELDYRYCYTKNVRYPTLKYLCFLRWRLWWRNVFLFLILLPLCLMSHDVAWNYMFVSPQLTLSFCHLLIFLMCVPFQIHIINLLRHHLDYGGCDLWTYPLGLEGGISSLRFIIWNHFGRNTSIVWATMKICLGGFILTSICWGLQSCSNCLHKFFFNLVETPLCHSLQSIQTSL